MFLFMAEQYSGLCVCVCVCTRIPQLPCPAAKSLQSCPTLCDPIDRAHQAPLSLGFSRQEHWSWLPFPFPMHESEVAQSCPTLSDPMDCSQLGSFVHVIFQAKVLEWGAIAFSLHVLAIVNSAAVKTGVHMSFSVTLFSGYMPNSGIVGSYDSFIPSFFKESPS